MTFIVLMMRMALRRTLAVVALSLGALAPIAHVDAVKVALLLTGRANHLKESAPGISKHIVQYLRTHHGVATKTFLCLEGNTDNLQEAVEKILMPLQVYV